MNAHKKVKVSVVIPALNEEAGVESVIKSVPVTEFNARGYDVEILVVDNGSTDRTAEVAQKAGATVVSQPLRGYGNAYKAGFASATGDIIATGDADMTYPVEALPDLVQKIENEKIDFLNTDRLETLRKESMSRSHVFGNWVLTTITKVLFNSPFSDSQSGMWVFKRSIWKELDVRSIGMPFSQELKLEAYWKGFVCGETAIDYRPRVGEVKLRGLHDAWGNTMHLFQKRLEIKRVQDRLPVAKATRIVIVSHYYPPHIGGIEYVSYNQAMHLAESGHAVTVVTSKVSSNERSYTSGKGVKVERVRALNPFERFGIPFPLFSPFIFPVLNKAIKNTDIVHIHDAFYISSLCAALLARWYKKPIVLTQHISLVPHPNRVVLAIQKLVYATTGAFIFRASSKIITLNTSVEKFLIERGIEPSKIEFLPNGIDTDIFYPIDPKEKRTIRNLFGLSLEKKIILFVGRFVPKKGFKKLLAAQSSKYQIVFAGGESRMTSNGSVVFLGKLSQETLAQVYKAADLFVLPSGGEGFPLSVQEAMASGLPVITTNDNGYSQYKFDKDKIHLIDNPTEETVREAINNIIHDDIRLREMSAYSKNYAAKNFSWPRIVSRLNGIYGVLI